MYTIYQSSPRRSPRQLSRMEQTSNILKTKGGSPIRKPFKSSQQMKKPLSSSNALANVTRPTTTKRKPKINDENKENSGVVTRPRATGVNGTIGKDRAVTSKSETRTGRTPLKEIALNGFVERLRKREVPPSIEIMSTMVTREQTNNTASEGTGIQNRNNTAGVEDFGAGVGDGLDWDDGGIIR